MTAEPTLEDWNWYEVMLNQAMLGSISPNFRMVTLSFTNNTWIISVTLEVDNEEDRDEICDIASECSIFVDGIVEELSDAADAKIEENIIISTETIIFDINDEKRVVFRRKEPPYNSAP